MQEKENDYELVSLKGLEVVLGDQGKYEAAE